MSRNFAPAAPSEETVYGACRPCHPGYVPVDDTVESWIQFIDTQGIDRVCCLLDDQQLALYNDLLARYRKEFAVDNVCHTPIADFSTVSPAMFDKQILPFLDDAEAEGQKVVVHCSAGSGRTGHILTLWLHLRRGFGLKKAIRTVEKTGRNPLEAASVSELQRIAQRSS